MNDDWAFGAIPAPPSAAAGPQARGDRFRPGQWFGVYQILDLLGEGGMGSVYRARDPAGREVALKVIRGRLNNMRRERFRREGELTSQVAHPGVVQVLGGGELYGVPFLVYELVAGATDLAAAFRSAPLERRVEWVRDAAAAVGHAHHRGVIHRDLKPDNVLLDLDGRVRVADFGLAKGETSDRLTRTGASLGTPGYMSPEQLMGDPVGPPADVWSLGVILYEALCGRLPFEGSSWTELQARVLHATPPPPSDFDPGVPAALQEVCLKALAKRAGQRYPDAAALAADLDAWLGQGVVGAQRDALRRQRSRQVRLGVGLGCVAAVALGLSTRSSKAVRPPASPQAVASHTPEQVPATQGDERTRSRWEEIRSLEDLDQQLPAAWFWLSAHPQHPLAEQARALLGPHLRRRPLLTQQVTPKGGNTRVAFVGDDLLLTHGRGLRLWRLSDRALLEVSDEKLFFSHVSVLPGGGLLVDSGGTELQLRPALDAPPRWTNPHASRYHALDASGEVVASTGEQGTVWLISASEGTDLNSLEIDHPHPCRGLVFTPAGTLLVARGSSVDEVTPGVARITAYDPVSGEQLAQSAPLPPLGTRSLCLSPDGAELTIGCFGGQVLFFDAQDLTQTRALVDRAEAGVGFLRGGAHTGLVNGIAFVPDGVRVVTASGGGVPPDQLRLKVWNYRTGEQTTEPRKLARGAYHAAVSPNGRLVALGSTDGHVDVWALDLP